MPVVAPIPSMRQRTAAMVKPGFLTSMRIEKRTSCQKVSTDASRLFWNTRAYRVRRVGRRSVSESKEKKIKRRSRSLEARDDTVLRDGRMVGVRGEIQKSAARIGCATKAVEKPSGRPGFGRDARFANTYG